MSRGVLDTTLSDLPYELSDHERLTLYFEAAGELARALGRVRRRVRRGGGLASTLGRGPPANRCCRWLR